MSQPGSFPNDCIYSLRLHRPAHARAKEVPALSGQLEHVMSGRRYPFSDAGQLLACLSLELARMAPADSA